jgi:hypothetical protein
MYSKILFKLIQESFIPAFGLLIIKILLTTYYSRTLGYNVDLYNVFSLQVSLSDYTLINSNVILGFVIFSFLGLAYCLVKSLFFHNSHVSPKMSLSVFNFRVGFLIQDSFHLFSQTLIWLIFNFSILFISVFLNLLGLIYGSVLLMSVILCLIGMYFFILDIEFEYRKSLEEEEEVFVL